ncbi:translin-associated protein X [Folsomia candida]|uniref:Translin-associated protein X n=1 Tax=Folsomia candida TaxID=158441 RepID=A0A226E6E2_FOLCA|nr:translin-associated protein X [Folsomia candida]OXA53195.1 Translin-associated protein X [Folsomia candida]
MMMMESSNPEAAPVPVLYTTEVAEMFDKAKAYLDVKRNKDDEIFHLTKDITYESKRIIFVLHRFFIYDDACRDAKRKLNMLLDSDRYFLGLAKALEGEDMSLHYRRYTHCVQECIEAMMFLHFIEHRKIPTYEDVKSFLVWVIKDEKCNTDPSATEKDANDDDGSDKPQEISTTTTSSRTLTVPLSLTDYMLGICDFTGELMKAAIPTLTKPKWHSFLYQVFALVREIYAQFAGICAENRLFRNKMSVMRASVIKIEATVYRLKMKILVYGRIPDSTDLQCIEYEEGDYGRGRVNRGGNMKTGNDDERDRGDSGVE